MKRNQKPSIPVGTCVYVIRPAPFRGHERLRVTENESVDCTQALCNLSAFPCQLRLVLKCVLGFPEVCFPRSPQIYLTWMLTHI